MFVTRRPTGLPAIRHQEGQSEIITIAMVVGGLVVAVVMFIGGYYLWKCRYKKEEINLTVLYVCIDKRNIEGEFIMFSFCSFVFYRDELLYELRIFKGNLGAILIHYKRAMDRILVTYSLLKITFLFLI